MAQVRAGRRRPAEIVHFIGGGNAPVDALHDARQAVRDRGQDLQSRLIIGTGKYKTYAENAARAGSERARRSSPSRCGG